ncbi:hypothetical protein [Nitrospirillum pindoramense]|uniref:hypothetical protein n=1 Tax=Nitrospirillum amazonense TaxID=28077 RepID=UPI00119E03C6|nr:hypothetical protein [Nitrospirillum amazonense]
MPMQLIFAKKVAMAADDLPPYGFAVINDVNGKVVTESSIGSIDDVRNLIKAMQINDVNNYYDDLINNASNDAEKALLQQQFQDFDAALREGQQIVNALTGEAGGSVLIYETPQAETIAQFMATYAEESTQFATFSEKLDIIIDSIAGIVA